MVHVFFTGASGFIGSIVVENLLRAGHTVTGLARSDASAATLTSLGARAHRGSLTDLASLTSGAAAADAVIHCAFIHFHDADDYVAKCGIDKTAIETLGAALAGSNKPFVITSGTLMGPRGRVLTEDDAADLVGGGPRAPNELVALALAAKGVRVSIIRLPPTVYDRGDKGFVTLLVGTARDKGVSAYVGEGQNRWPAVHRRDAARLYPLVLEKGVAGGVYHAVGDEAVKTRDLAESIGELLHVPVASIKAEEMMPHFGFLSMVIAIDGPASSKKTQEEMGWKPSEPGLIEALKLWYG